MAFTGRTVGLVLGTGGQSGAKNQAAVRPDQLILANNLTFEGITIQKEGGATKYNSTAVSGTPNIIAGWDWDHNGSTQRQVIVTDAGTILRDDGSGDFTATTLKSGLTVANQVPVFLECGLEAAGNNKKLFCFTGANVVQVLDGNAATTSDLTTPPADWATTNQPKFGAVHEGRVWAGGNVNDPHRLYYSTTTNHEDFTGAGSGSLSIYPGESDRLVWAVSYKGYLVCAKHPHGVYVIDTTDPTVGNWKINRITGSIGGVGPRAMCVVENDIIFMDDSLNIYALSSVEQFGDLGTRSLTDTASFGPYLRTEMDPTYLDNASAIFYPSKREAIFCMTSTGSTVNNRRLVIDYNIPDQPRFRVSDRDNCTCIWLYENTDNIRKPRVGDNAGFVWNLDEDSRNKDGSGYTGEFQTPHLDFSFIDPALGPLNTRWSWLEMQLEPEGDPNLSVDVYLDERLSETIQFSMGTGEGVALGTFILGTNALRDRAIISKRKSLHGRSRTISLKGSNGGANESFSLIKFFFGFNTSDTERLR
jgi:hypothetical protein